MLTRATRKKKKMPTHAIACLHSSSAIDRYYPAPVGFFMKQEGDPLLVILNGKKTKLQRSLAKLSWLELV